MGQHLARGLVGMSLVTQHPGGSAAEWATLAAIVRTIGSNFPEVARVQVMVDGQPLETLEIVVNLIGSTTTESGLKVYAKLDPSTYQKGRTVTAEELASLNLQQSRFHGEWNYVIHPNR